MALASSSQDHHTLQGHSKKKLLCQVIWILECSRQQCLLSKLWPAHPSCRICACSFLLPSKKLLLQFLKWDTASDPVVTLTTAIPDRGAHTAPQRPRSGAEAWVSRPKGREPPFTANCNEPCPLTLLFLAPPNLWPGFLGHTSGI